MLDANLLKFVEPIGPGQIVDRESLVALPAGQLQLTIETNRTQVTVRVLEMRAAYDFSQSDDNSALNWQVNAYIWQNGQVIAAEKLGERPVLTRSKTLPGFGTMGKKRSVSTGPRGFRFAKEAPSDVTDCLVVDAILQICVYKNIGITAQKIFLGTVHIALNYLSSQEFQVIEGEAVCKAEWFKVFPKSTFLPGCPSGIAKTNCAISGAKKQSETVSDNSQESTAPRVTLSPSGVFFSQYRLTCAPGDLSWSDSIIPEPKETLPCPQTDSNPTIAHRILSWAKRKILQKGPATPLPTSQRTPDSAKSGQVRDLAPVLVGPGRRLKSSYSAPAACGLAPETSPLEAIGNGKADRFPIPERRRSAKGTVRKIQFQASRSNSSSFDVGYESSRSRCLSSSDEEPYHVSAESNLDSLYERDAETAVVHGAEDEVRSRECAPSEGAFPASSGDKIVKKRRPGVTRRGGRIIAGGAVGFAPQKKIQISGFGGSQDCIIFADQ